MKKITSYLVPNVKSFEFNSKYFLKFYLAVAYNTLPFKGEV